MRLKTFIISMFLISFLLPAIAFCDDSLHKAAYRGDIESVKALLKKDIDPDERDAFGGTALHAAMFQKNTEIITLLIDHGLDVNAKGTSNGYTPLHDAVWANNIEAVKVLMAHGARTDIKAKDGLTPYQKAVKENRTEIVHYMNSDRHGRKSYDYDAKTLYSVNDVKAFVYQWFAGFDHQADIAFFEKHLDPDRVDMHFPDFPVKNLIDFERWYNDVIANIKWNAHEISHLTVTGNEKDGFSVSLDVNWKARTYDGKNLDLNVHQDWKLAINHNRNFIIERHRAELIDGKRIK